MPVLPDAAMLLRSVCAASDQRSLFVDQHPIDQEHDAVAGGRESAARPADDRPCVDNLPGVLLSEQTIAIQRARIADDRAGYREWVRLRRWIAEKDATHKRPPKFLHAFVAKDFLKE